MPKLIWWDGESDSEGGHECGAPAGGIEGARVASNARPTTHRDGLPLLGLAR